MTVRASFDDCNTWPLQKLIFAGPAAYSGLAVGKEGTIFLVYEHAGLGKKESRENISIARFNLAWLKQTEIGSPEIIPKSQAFFDNQEIIIKADKNFQIRYTLDGTEPGPESPLYSDPIQLTSTTLETIQPAMCGLTRLFQDF